MPTITFWCFVSLDPEWYCSPYLEAYGITCGNWYHSAAYGWMVREGGGREGREGGREGGRS